MGIEERTAVIAAHALNRGVGVEEAWAIAEQIAASDVSLREACEEAVRVADQKAWPSLRT